MIVAICNQKGGTGKSTIAVNLAVGLMMAGVDVCLIDADPQRSALDWASDRGEQQPRVPVAGLPIEQIGAELRPLARRHALLLIDGGGRITTTARATIAVCDAVIIPTAPSKPDLVSTEDFWRQVIDVAPGRRRAATFLNLVTPTRLAHDAETFVRGRARPVLTTVWRRYTVFGDAFVVGLAVPEYAPQSKAAADVRALVEEVRTWLENGPET